MKLFSGKVEVMCNNHRSISNNSTPVCIFDNSLEDISTRQSLRKRLILRCSPNRDCYLR